jgi:5-methylcytosine-specific restriction protein A
MYLSANPLCQLCQQQGTIRPATVVHHIRELSQGGARLDPSNLMAVCADHHEQIHGGNRWKKREKQPNED